MTPPTNDDIADLERRNESRRLSDRHWLMAGLGVLGIIASAGIAFGTSSATTQSALAHKLDREEYLRDKAAQNTEIAALQGKVDDVYQLLRDIKATGDSTAIRVREIACARQPVSCR